jgi:hypothetical protein
LRTFTTPADDLKYQDERQSIDLNPVVPEEKGNVVERSRACTVYISIYRGSTKKVHSTSTTPGK